MSQNEENVKNLISGPILTHLAQIQAQFFFQKLYLYQKLDVVASYHARQFQEKLISQAEENTKNLILGPIFAHLTQVQAQIFFPKLYLYQKLDIVASYHPRQFQEKLISQAEENTKNLILGPILAHFTQVQAQNFFRKLYLYQKLDIVASYHPRQFLEKLISQAEENMKNLILGPILVHLTEICAPKFFREFYHY